MNTRLSLLLMALLCTSTLASAQELVTSTSPGTFIRASGPRDQSLLLRVYLTLQLVKHPHMNDQQVRVILEAITLVRPEFSFRNTSSNDKSDLWRTHLALSLIKRSEPSARQTEIILAAMLLATHELFEVPSSDPDWRATVQTPLRSLEERYCSRLSLKDASARIGTWMEFLRMFNGIRLLPDTEYLQWRHL